MSKQLFYIANKALRVRYSDAGSYLEMKVALDTGNYLEMKVALDAGSYLVMRVALDAGSYSELNSANRHKNVGG